MHRIIFAALVMSAALAGGCAGEGVYYTGGGTVTATTVAPDLLYVSPGVQVVADYDYPVFYADNYYWRFDNGGWYRSSWYTGGWVYATPPSAVLTIDRPYAYRHYRPSGYVSRNTYVRDHRDYRDYRAPVYRDSRPVYRDTRQRYEGGPVYRDNSPTVRDHRTPVYREAPVVREHRTEPAPRSAPAPREQRDHRDRRDRRSDGTVTRDHR